MRKFASGAVLALLLVSLIAATPGTMVRLGVQDIYWGYGTWNRAARTTTGTVAITKMTPVNALAFGVDNTGATDCVDSLNALIAVVSAAGGGIVYCPAGTYKLNTKDTGTIKLSGSDGSIIQLKPDVSIVGDGPQTVFKIAAGLGDYESIFHQDNPTTAELNDVVYRDFAVDFNADSNTVDAGVESDNNSRFGFLVLDGSNIRFDNLKFIDGDCINTIMLNGNYYTDNDIQNVAITNCSFIGTGNPDVDHDHSTIYFQGGDGISVQGCYFEADALTDYGANCAVETHGSNQTITGNIVVNYEAMFNVSGVAESDNYGASVVGNSGYGLSYGVRIFSRYYTGHTTGYGIRGVTVSGNTINIAQFSRQSGRATTHNYGIGLVGYATLQAPAYDLSISGNTVAFELESVASATPTLASGIAFYNGGVSDTMSVYNANISGNVIEYAPGPGIWLQGRLWGISVNNNTIINPGQTQNAATASAYKAGMYVYVEEGRDISIGNNMIADNLATGRMVWGVECFADEAISGFTLFGNRATKRQGTFTARQQMYVQAPLKPLMTHIGSGTPLNGVRAGIGSIWQRTDGGAGYTTYYKETETDTTGWVRRQHFSGVYADSVYERTSAAGVRIDGALVKDGAFIVKTNTTARAADDSLAATEEVIYFTGQSASTFCTLPTTASVPVGKTYTIINADATPDTVFVEANGAELLNGSALRRAVALPTQYSYARFVNIGGSVHWLRMN